ncbi:MAG: ubiquitin family protein [Candidatus Heimdallarchaeum endolithica]|uniref:Ubiquitin family protein n=1 Tax=Candidatus Heimdallarchaeum endolithica TaxID=2876572 RepID=A0A9Y1BNW0_9ARCH|nr:MAG: ubiquitin family protein [Candidatus Heimdallarchaeum endolithica]
MKLSIVTAIGGGLLELDVDSHQTIAQLKREVSRMKKIPANTVILVHHGQQLDDGETIKSCGLQEGDKLYLIARTKGGF